MRKRFGSVVHIGLSKTGATVILTSGWRQTHNEVLAEWSGSDEECALPETVINRLGALLQNLDCTHLPAKIVLSDSWVRRWMVVPPHNATSLADCQAAANVRFQALFGEAMSGWHLSADWNARQPFLACAIPRSLLTALQQVTSEHKLVLLEVAPQFVVAWNRWRKDIQEGIWFGVLHHTTLTLAVVGRNGLTATHDVILPDTAMHDQHRVPEILARTALRLNVPMPPEIRLCGQIPVHWMMQKIGNLSFVSLDQNWSENNSKPAAKWLSSGLSLAYTGMHP